MNENQISMSEAAKRKKKRCSNLEWFKKLRLSIIIAAKTVM